MKHIDPFTRTPGVAGTAFIDMHYADSIIENFTSDESSKYIYKIVGLRGSGKSVEYRKIMSLFMKKKKWLVFTLSAAGDPLNALIAKLSQEKIIDSKIHSTSLTTELSTEAKAVVVGGSANVSMTKISEENPSYYSPEATLSDMIQRVNNAGYHLLVGIDDIARTPDMVKFLSIWGSMLLDDRKKIYLICTGLAKNIEDFSKEANLTFFKRSDTIEIKKLDKYEIAAMYQKLLGVSGDIAVRLSKLTCGYAYAYQVLGSLYFNKKEKEKIEDLMPAFDRILFGDSYDLIWTSLTPSEQAFVRYVTSIPSGKASEIKSKMKHPSSYDSLRARLESKHLIDVSNRGYIQIDLPRFRQYVQLWHSEDTDME